MSQIITTINLPYHFFNIPKQGLKTKECSYPLPDFPFSILWFMILLNYYINIYMIKVTSREQREEFWSVFFNICICIYNYN